MLGAAWVLPWRPRLGRASALGLCLFLASLSAWLLAVVILPAYTPPKPALALPTGDMSPLMVAAGRALFARPVPFGQDIVLDGYDLHRRDLAPGQKLRVWLYWRALRAPGADYRVSVQLRDGPAILAQSDAGPVDETRPTRGWAAGETITDRHVMRVPADAPTGVFQLYVVLYIPGGRPLAVHLRDFELDLGPVQVREDD